MSPTYANVRDWSSEQLAVAADDMAGLAKQVARGGDDLIGARQTVWSGESAWAGVASDAALAKQRDLETQVEGIAAEFSAARRAFFEASHAVSGLESAVIEAESSAVAHQLKIDDQGTVRDIAPSVMLDEDEIEEYQNERQRRVDELADLVGRVMQRAHTIDQDLCAALGRIVSGQISGRGQGSDSGSPVAAYGGPLGFRTPIAGEGSGAPRDGSRSSLLDELEVSDEQWGDLVDDKTIYRGATNVRYFDIEPTPGGGVIIVDWWIPGSTSGGILSGDGRGDSYVDPLTGERNDEPLELTDSRILVAMDLETGRASITQSQTCSRSFFGWDFCEEPRDISFGDGMWVNDSENDDTPEGINIELANRFDVESIDNGYRFGFDGLNSIIPFGSVDGALEFQQQSDGSFVSERSGDDYPAIAVTSYHDGETEVTMHPNEGLPHVVPWYSDLSDLLSNDNEQMAPGPPEGQYDEEPVQVV